MTEPSAQMLAAIQAAEAVRGSTSPNPWVGAAVVRDGRVISTGATSPYGGPHAEAAALANIDARGADLYATLEPCMPFEGKQTRPCVDAILEAGIRRLFVALEDPHAAVRGRGAQFLRDRGVTVEVGDGAEEVTRLLRAYLKFRDTGLPYVIAKFAVSVDGMVGAPSAGVRWLTGSRAIERSHDERRRIDAILVGSGTVIADNPGLTARSEGQLVGRQPVRIVLDGAGRISAEAKVLGPGAIVATGRSDSRWREAVVKTGATILELEEAEDGLNLAQLLAALGQRNVMSLIAEGGPTVLSSLFGGEHVDEVHAYIAPLLLGSAGIPLASGRAFEPSVLSEVVLEELSPDVLVRGYTGNWSPVGARR